MLLGRVLGNAVCTLKYQDLDGVKLLLGDAGWILFRGSGTEPVLRVYCEATSRAVVDRLIDAELLRAPPDRRQDLQLMKSLVHSHAQALSVYLCSQCGFKARQFYWHCPACNGWETYPPRRAEERELAS